MQIFRNIVFLILSYHKILSFLGLFNMHIILQYNQSVYIIFYFSFTIV